MNKALFAYIFCVRKYVYIYIYIYIALNPDVKEVPSWSPLGAQRALDMVRDGFLQA